MQKHSGNILINPRVTEKGAYLAESGCYVFNVTESANKYQIAEAIRTVFKVTPRKVTVARVPRKQVQTRGTNRKAMTVGGKKAYVYLKKGDKIELA
jgi:large subunit ribosomal protein L23